MQIERSNIVQNEKNEQHQNEASNSNQEGVQVERPSKWTTHFCYMDTFLLASK